MSALTWAAVLGAGIGVGLVCVLAAIHAAGPDLATRVRQGRPASGSARGGGTWSAGLREWALGLVEMIGSTTSSVERRLLLLGNPRGLGAFRLQQFASAILGMSAAGALSIALIVRGRTGLVLALPLVVLGALAGAALCDQLLTVRSRGRQRAIDAQVPDASELLALAIGAGESVPGALERVARISASHLAGELDRTGSQIRLGLPISHAITELAARNDAPSLDRLCQTLVTALERGSPLAAVLHDQARDIREASRQRLMEEGGRREIAMLLPVVFLILPTTVLFALYPGMIALTVGT